MRILAIETSGSAGSVAIFDAGQLLTREALDPALRSARTLAPTIRQMLMRAAWKPSDVQIVAVGIGPGSFTGLRLGVMTAKAFAYAVGAQVMAISTLAAIALQASEAPAEITAAIDAQRGEVYRARFSLAPAGEIEPQGEIAIVTAEEWLESLAPDVIATGPALVKLCERIGPDVRVAPRERWFPDAEAIGRLAAWRAARGESDDLWSLAPLYLRRSAAEEKWDSRAM